MTVNNKTWKSGKPSAFATAFSYGAPFPGLKGMSGGKKTFATAVTKQKELVGETHPLLKSFLNPHLKSPRAELSGNLAVGISHSRVSPDHVLWWEGTLWPA